jgi:hypothetical protein
MSLTKEERRRRYRDCGIPEWWGEGYYIMPEGQCVNWHETIRKSTGFREMCALADKIVKLSRAIREHRLQQADTE